MKSWSFVSRDPEQTHALGCELGRSIGAEGLFVALVGPLGSGKTVFVKGLAEGLGVEPRAVSSPTFVIAQQYVVPQGPDALYHVDLYRLERAEELESIGFYDMLAPGGVIAVEWADRFPGVLGPDTLRIEFEGPAVEEGAGGRLARVSADGGRSLQVSGDWFSRVERLGSAGRSTSGLRSAKALVACLVSSGLLAAASIGGWAESRATEPCGSWVAAEADALGTARVQCVGRTRNALPAERRTRGIARLLEGERIDLNQAGVDLLRALPGIGPTRAERLVRARSERAFDSIEEIERVPGIGPVLRSRLTKWLCVGERAAVGGCGG